MAQNGFLISAPQSGCGKTTISLAIMAALARRGTEVAPFKCGPDFIDPGYHRAVSGRASINLDSWMCSEDFVRQAFQTGLTGLESPAIAVIEGAMGLFDGAGASCREGSSARIAAITGAAVVLVVSARGMAASAAALVAGFAGFDPQVRLAGVIFNNVGSERHAQILKEALAAHCPGISCFGCVPHDELLGIPARHLGLVTVEDNPLAEDFIRRLADMAECFLDLERLSELCLDAPEINARQTGVPQTNSSPKSRTRLVSRVAVTPVRIAVARDAAFCFMYGDNLRLLQEAGAELVFFSPLTDAALPVGIAGIYLPGGYPELYAGQLARNENMKRSLRVAVESDTPLYAECGGFVYLTEGLDSSDHQAEADFVGIFPVRSRMLARRKALGYRQAELLEDLIIGTKGMVVRGHEFHYSEIDEMPADIERCYRISRQSLELGTEGFRWKKCLASYIHLHFGSNREMAPAFVASCSCV